MATTSHVSRRSLLAVSASALAITSVPASVALASTAADPVFAAIEAHRHAKAALDDVHAARERAEEALGVPNWPVGFMLREHYAKRWKADPALRAVIERQQPAFDAEEEAFKALLAAKPNTPAGLIALATYGCELSEGTDGQRCDGALPAHRILGAIAGLPELELQMPAPEDDDEDFADDEQDDLAA
jgi:hypothetical protein